MAGWWEGLDGVWLVQEFKQSHFSNRSKGGYCKGCSLDWIRRVLCKPDRLLPGYNLGGRVWSVGKYTYANPGGSAQRMQSIQDLYQSQKLNIDSVRQYTNTASGAIDRDLTAKKRIAAEGVEKSLGRKEGRTFGSIEVVRTVMLYENDGTDEIQAGIAKALVESGRAAMVSLDFVDDVGDSATGHAVAVSRFVDCAPDAQMVHGLGRYMFFDPNYGIFNCTPQGLHRILVRLFGPKGEYDEINNEEVRRTTIEPYSRPNRAGLISVFGRKGG